MLKYNNSKVIPFRLFVINSVLACLYAVFLSKHETKFRLFKPNARIIFTGEKYISYMFYF